MSILSKTLNGNILSIEGDVDYDFCYNSCNIHVAYEAKIRDGKLISIGYLESGDKDPSELWRDAIRDEIRPFLY